jgi:hypothetical protein
MTALLIIGTTTFVVAGALFTLWCLLATAKQSDEEAQRETQEAWADLVSLQHLAAERARQELKDRLLHQRMRSVREGRDDA